MKMSNCTIAFTHWLPDDTEAVFPEKKS